MNLKLKSTLWWIFAVFFTIAMASYQKRTGPTYPISGKATLNGNEIKYKLIRTAENDKDAEIALNVPDTNIKGTITYKRYKSNDSLTTVPLIRRNDTLFFMMPTQPAAGKMMYEITLSSGSEQVVLKAKKDEFVVMRFKGPVPLYILIPHILAMFLGLLFSTRTAIEALIGGARTYKLALSTLALLVLGGLILGPVVQKYAFGAYWTGWPLAGDGTFNLFRLGDMTDNKTLVMVLAWVVAIFKLRKDPKNKFWPAFAAVMVMIVYLIPHSVLGSEIDHTKAPKL
ncbi:MAG: hypothetical protein Q7U54_02950 [Bacteroidales bacterium]|nr:hypothetical protein [Bacteroidales bacterium]